MVKNWLIRTKTHHILGPVSREKLLELAQNGSVKDEDEVCSGNGYWFFLREKDLVGRHLTGGEPQPFNPICEAPDVLGRAASNAQPVPHNEDITLLSSPNLAALRGVPPPPPSSTMRQGTARPEGGDRAPALEPPAPKDEEPEPAAPGPIRRPSVPHAHDQRPPVASPTPMAPGRNPRRRPSVPPRPAIATPAPRRFVSDKVVMVGAVALLLALATMLYYRKRLLREILGHATSALAISPALAQEGGDDGKKKACLGR